MKLSKMVYFLSLVTGLVLLAAGILMKCFAWESHGWLFSKRGTITQGVLNADGTLVLGILLLVLAIVQHKTVRREKEQHDRKVGIEKNEARLSKTYNIFKIRKANKAQD